MGFDGVLTCTVAMMDSFCPVAALSSLSNNLNQALASGERVLSLLEEAPVVEEIPGEEPGNAHAFPGQRRRMSALPMTMGKFWRTTL